MIKMKNKTEKEKFFYDEVQDKIIVDFVKNELAKRQEERKKFELIWELNMNFFFGNQYCYISNNNEISDIEKRYFWENREVYNHIAPIIEARLSKLGKINPSFSVKSNSIPGQKTQSSVLENTILQSAITNNNFKELISSATYWSEITGTSFYKISWENDIGDIIVKDETKTIKNGDVKISVCSPFEIYPDSNGAENIEDCESIIEVRSLPVKLVNEKYKTNFIGGDIDLFELGNKSFLSGISGRSNITKVIHSKKHNQALVVERYEKPSPSNPNGKLTIICENKLIYDGELPYILGNNSRTFPFVKQISSRQIGCFWGASVIERCIPIQRSYNAIKNKKHEFIERLAGGVLSVEDGSVDVDNLEEEGLAPGKILIYRNGSTPPKFIDVNEIPKELEDEEEKLIEELSRVSSVSEVMSSSNVPGNLNSGSALSMLINQDNSRLSLTAENIRQAITKVAKFILKLYKQFAEIPRMCLLTDEKGLSEPHYWNKNNLFFEDVYLDVSNELDENSNSNKETLISLFEKGMFNEDDGKISNRNKQKLLLMLGVKNFDFEDEIDKLNKLNANNENQNLESLSEPCVLDNHKLHIYEHTKFMLTNSAKNLSEKDREKMLTHIENHKKFLKEGQ